MKVWKIVLVGSFGLDLISGTLSGLVSGIIVGLVVHFSVSRIERQREGLMTLKMIDSKTAVFRYNGPGRIVIGGNWVFEWGPDQLGMNNGRGSFAEEVVRSGQPIVATIKSFGGVLGGSSVGQGCYRISAGETVTISYRRLAWWEPSYPADRRCDPEELIHQIIEEEKVLSRRISRKLLGRYRWKYENVILVPG